MRDYLTLKNLSGEETLVLAEEQGHLSMLACSFGFEVFVHMHFTRTYSGNI